MHSVASYVYVVSLLFLAKCIKACEDEQEDWTYEDQSRWAFLNGSFCGGSSQSPIDIRTSDVADGDIIGLRQLVMTNWDEPIRGEWSNDGHTFKFTPDADVMATTETHQGLYNLEQFHFHWGPDPRVGSEHLVDGVQYSGELHFVHKRGTEYTVVSVLLVENPATRFYGTVWDTLASRIPPYKSAIVIDGVVLNDMLPIDLDYYYYYGSFTTPLCDEVVQWIVLRDYLHVPTEFFNLLLRTPGSRLEENNYRHVQPLNSRQVYLFLDQFHTRARGKFGRVHQFFPDSSEDRSSSKERSFSSTEERSSTKSY